MKRNTFALFLAAIAVACLGSSWLISGAIGTGGTALQNNSYRDRMLQPERVMTAIGVRPGMVIGEVGAGEGYFTFWLSKRVGENGRIYANDIDEHALKHIVERCRSEGVDNIVTVVGEPTDPLFPTRELEMAVMVYTLHHIEKPLEFLITLKSYLKSDATVVVIEQNPETTGSTHFFRKEHTVELMQQAGYEFLRHETFLQRDYVSVFRVNR